MLPDGMLNGSNAIVRMPMAMSPAYSIVLTLSPQPPDDFRFAIAALNLGPTGK